MLAANNRGGPGGHLSPDKCNRESTPPPDDASEHAAPGLALFFFGASLPQVIEHVRKDRAKIFFDYM